MANDGAGPHWIEAWTRDEGERRAGALLLNAFGAIADATASAPGRVTIMGEYTDISRGFSLPTIIPHRAYVALRRRDDDVVRIAYDPHAGTATSGTWTGTLSDPNVAADGLWVKYLAGPIWALQERGYLGPGLDIAVTSCVPFGAGVSSLVAASAAVALGINAVWGLGLPVGADAHELADVCVDVENDFVGAATAGLSQHTILRCPEGEALLLDFSTTPPEATACPLYFPEYGLSLVIVHAGPSAATQAEMVRSRIGEITAAAHALGVEALRDLHGDPQARAKIEAMTDPILRLRARHAVGENARVELVRDELAGTAPAHERFVEIGKAMYRSHASLDTNVQVSSTALNLAVDTAFGAGALGAHMVGAGVDSSVVVLVRKLAVASTVQTIDQAFVTAGLARPAFMII